MLIEKERCQAVLLQEELGLQCWGEHRVPAVWEQGWGRGVGTPLPALAGQSQPWQPLHSSNPHSGLDLYALETATSPEAQGVRSPQHSGPDVGDISAHVCPCLGPAIVPATCFLQTPCFPLHELMDLVLSQPLSSY